MTPPKKTTASKAKKTTAKKGAKAQVEPKFQVENFHGTVTLQHFMMGLKGSYWGVSGIVSILATKDIVGFEPDPRDPHWVARIQSPTDPDLSVTILGCQVRAVLTHKADEPVTNPEVWVL